MKFFNKSNKTNHSKKPKRQPDPILAGPKRKSEKLGRSQTKRLQKRIKLQYGKKDKVKGNKKHEEKVNLKHEENEIEEQDKSEEEMIIDEETNEIEAKKVDGFGLVNEGNEEEVEEDDGDLEKQLNDDSDNEDEDEDDISMRDDDEDIESMEEDNDEDKESIIEDNNQEEDDDNEDKMITNINVGDDTIKVTDLDSLNSRIKSNMDILVDYKKYKTDNKSNCKPRQFYVTQFLNDLCMKFSYNEFLMGKLYELFTNELFQFLVSSEEDRPITIRTNTLKTRRRQLKEVLMNRECNVENLEFSKVGMVVFSSKTAIGATPEYLAGHYILQGSSSMLPVMALAPQRGDRILDLCAAPGGKTSHIAQIMANTGIIFANDVNKDRLKAVMSNLARMGVMNTIITNHDGRTIHRKVKDFDRVLCDAPCTGTGVISKDKSIKASKDDNDLKMLTCVQKQLICAAVDACKVGGYIVYSTCSILVEENEQVVDYVCRKRNVKIVETGLFGVKGFVNFCSKHFNQNMDRTRRYYPHKNNMDGFYLAKLQKVGETKVTQNNKNMTESENKEISSDKKTAPNSKKETQTEKKTAPNNKKVTESGKTSVSTKKKVTQNENNEASIKKNGFPSDKKKSQNEKKLQLKNKKVASKEKKTSEVKN